MFEQTDPREAEEMRRYDEPVEVRKGRVGDIEGPEQFLWRGRLWKVRDVVGRWVETGPWWEPSAVGTAGAVDQAGLRGDLVAEREFWRVDATAGRESAGHGIFDLVFDWAGGSWRLTRCLD